MTMQGASLIQTAGATEDALIGLTQTAWGVGACINVSHRLIHYRLARQAVRASWKCTILNWQHVSRCRRGTTEYIIPTFHLRY